SAPATVRSDGCSTASTASAPGSRRRRRSSWRPGGATSRSPGSRSPVRPACSSAQPAADPRASTTSGTARRLRAALHVLEAETALDAQVPARRVVVVGGGDLHDLVVLHVQGEVAADAAVRTDRVDLRLARLIPLAGLTEVVLALEHERAGRADGDAVPAVDA